MTEWSLPDLLFNVHKDVESRLVKARELIGHPGQKGDASECVWRDVLRLHLPLRYQVDTGFVVDSLGSFSQQIDIIISDRQYSPLVFEMTGVKIFPVESLYAVFEAKQSVNKAVVQYAKTKAASVKRLHRTNQPIRHLDGKLLSKPVEPILAGLLALDSDWNPPLGAPLASALETRDPGEVIDYGCVAAHGLIEMEADRPKLVHHEKAATAFVFGLITRLQKLGTVPAIDMSAYGRHLG